MLQEMPVMSSGGGGGKIGYTLENNGGCWYIISNDELLKTHPNGYGNSLNYTDDYITIDSSANSFAYTVTFNKACTVTSLPNNGSTSTSAKTAGSTMSCDASNLGFFAVFE